MASRQQPIATWQEPWAHRWRRFREAMREWVGTSLLVFLVVLVAFGVKLAVRYTLAEPDSSPDGETVFLYVGLAILALVTTTIAGMILYFAWARLLPRPCRLWPDRVQASSLREDLPLQDVAKYACYREAPEQGGLWRVSLLLKNAHIWESYLPGAATAARIQHHLRDRLPGQRLAQDMEIPDTDPEPDAQPKASA